jgi:AcrR family transcriptional regulator
MVRQYWRMTQTRAGRAGYHHGDLPNALADAATELARGGGPEAVVLREAARRVGVSAAAAYRHYMSHGELLQAVKQRAIEALADALSAGLASGQPLASPKAEALRRFRNLGLAYVGFARANPGLFHTAFCRSDAGAGAGADAGAGAGAGAGPGPAPASSSAEVHARIAETRPYQILAQSLDDLVAVGMLEESRRAAAPIAFWSAVHGLATLLVDGPLAALTEAEQDWAADRTLDILVEGIERHPA